MYKKYLFEKNYTRTFVDAHAQIQNMHLFIMNLLCIFYVHFGAFNMVEFALKCLKKKILQVVVN